MNFKDNDKYKYTKNLNLNLKDRLDLRSFNTYF